MKAIGRGAKTRSPKFNFAGASIRIRPSANTVNREFIMLSTMDETRRKFKRTS